MSQRGRSVRWPIHSEATRLDPGTDGPAPTVSGRGQAHECMVGADSSDHTGGQQAVREAGGGGGRGGVESR